jgi:UDPglucose--hexose-1-phosphate uridylyltransferase
VPSRRGPVSAGLVVLLMSELRRDPVTDRWVIITPERGVRPRDFVPEPEDELGPLGCPFCEGNERMTPPEVLGLRDRGERDRSGWYVRVVPHKFPVLRVEGSTEVHEEGLLRSLDGIGAHEIVIENPRHDLDLAFAPVEQVIRVIAACQQRVEDLRRDRRFRHIIVYRNHRKAAGASTSHPHSQVIALPIVPQLVQREVMAARDYFREQGKCLFCSLIEQERAAAVRVVAETAHHVAICPYASCFPFAVTIYPLQHCHDFVQMGVAERADLAGLLRSLLAALRSALFNPPYNLVYQTVAGPDPAVPDAAAPPKVTEVYHWHINIMPRFTPAAGFEWGTGFYTNPVAPEEAATSLREHMQL